MSDVQAFAAEIFNSQPFTRWIGAELVSVGSDHADIGLHVSGHHRQQHGFVHGGVLSYLADNALTFAGGVALGGDALTSEFKINYIRPARGGYLMARARTIGKGKRQAVCQCEILSNEDSGSHLCAVAQGTIISVAVPAD
ncbi:PaaI family thioesterase [Aquamicrobium ahrensii]|uniref:Medium/long-chain acyl-CoA thioesterase YigI n=1 Tax=Aquamicrobium ahrensii TaxID=469551 RepID=A0ABV2KP70_9HYPH